MASISAVNLPDHLNPAHSTGAIAVVIDVLRATTTIATAFDHGANCVIPVASIDAARMIAHERDGSLLCGERAGMKPEGFALGNSPAEYAPSQVQGRDLVLTTTNGTRALHMCEKADEIITASITNLNAACSYLREHNRDIILVCSGTDGRVSLEDCIGAGLIVETLKDSHTPDDSASLMLCAAIGAIETHDGLPCAIGASFHARRLNELGFASDVAFASQRSISTAVPVFNPCSGEIRNLAQNLPTPS